MKGHKQVWVDNRYVRIAKGLKRKSPTGRKVSLAETINDCIEIGMKKKGHLKNGEEKKS